MNDINKGNYGYSNNGYSDGIDCIHMSWPWKKLNDTEKAMIDKTFLNLRPVSDLTYDEGWDETTDIWHKLLKIIGCEPLGWRMNGDIPPYDETKILVFDTKESLDLYYEIIVRER